MAVDFAAKAPRAAVADGNVELQESVDEVERRGKGLVDVCSCANRLPSFQP